MTRKLAVSLGLLAALAAGIGTTVLTPSPAAAFCGFYVAGADAKLFANATVVVLMRDGTRTVLSMQNDYQGPPEDFALVIPVPVVLKEGDVKVLRKDLFDRVDKLAAPRLVEYWEEDPCSTGLIGLGNTGLIGKGGGGGTGSGYGRGGSPPTVTIEAQFEVGEYEIVILSATESNGLDSWLRENGYNIPAGAEPLLRPYVEQGSKFFVAKVNPAKVQFAGNGRTMLSPIRFHYDSEEFSLPVRLGLINAPDASSGSLGKQDLLVHILAPNTRYQVSNYPNVTIPTNLDLQDAAKDGFAEFYVSLFDHTIAQTPGAVVTEYAWSAGGCDPCPGPDAALTNQELLELGADALPNWADQAAKGVANSSQVVHSKATVSEGLDKDIIRRIVRAHINEIRFCYNQALQTKPSLAGRLAIDFTIKADGKVSGAIAKPSTLSDPDLEQCMTKAVSRWTFPKPTGGKLVTVSYPFTLQPTGGPGSGGGGGVSGSFVLTRLHARYDASSLAEDLVFETAGPIVGGREAWGVDGKLEQGTQTGTSNNFQARYAIRHPWAGAIACESPVRGRWGGPPEGGLSSPTLAGELASVGRGSALGSFVTTAASEQLGVAAIAAVDVPPRPKLDETKPTETKPEPATKPDKPASGCGCSTDTEPGLPAALLGVIALLGLRRRRVRGAS